MILILFHIRKQILDLKIDLQLIGISDNGSKLVWGISASRLSAFSEKYLPKTSAIRLSSVYSFLLTKTLLIVFLIHGLFTTLIYRLSFDTHNIVKFSEDKALIFF